MPNFTMPAYVQFNPLNQNKAFSFIGNDDYRAMEEVVHRHYKRLADEGKPLPDLIIIDGGLGQVQAALNAFRRAQLTFPNLIGLAKREETIVFSDDRPPLNLKHNDPALQLLQRIRDEAHRFANTFNAALRSRKIKESILDDFKGLGKKRKTALIQHFGSIQNLRKATVTDILAIEGIGPVLAERLVEFLKKN